MKNRRNFLQKLSSFGIFAGLVSLSGSIWARPKAEKLFIHHVFFWLKEPENQEVRQKFEKALNKLGGIEAISMLHIGTPADNNRDIIDNTYHYSLLMGFKSRKDHDIYQEHPIHDDFRNNYNDLWEKVLVYDSVDI